MSRSYNEIIQQNEHLLASTGVNYFESVAKIKSGFCPRQGFTVCSDATVEESGHDYGSVVTRQANHR